MPLELEARAERSTVSSFISFLHQMLCLILIKDQIKSWTYRLSLEMDLDLW